MGNKRIKLFAAAQMCIRDRYTITVSFLLKEDTLWAKKGHEVAFGQNVYEVAKAEQIHKGEFEVINSDHNFGVKGENFEEMCIRDRKYRLRKL